MQFLIEIAIIGVYFALGTRVVLPNDHGIKQPDELWKGACLVAIYCLYLVWDLLDIGIASMEASSATRDGRAADALELRRWALKATRGMTVTVVFLLVFGVFLGIGDQPTTSPCLVGDGGRLRRGSDRVSLRLPCAPRARCRAWMEVPDQCFTPRDRLAAKLRARSPARSDRLTAVPARCVERPPFGDRQDCPVQAVSFAIESRRGRVVRR